MTVETVRKGPLMHEAVCYSCGSRLKYTRFDVNSKVSDLGEISYYVPCSECDAKVFMGDYPNE